MGHSINPSNLKVEQNKAKFHPELGSIKTSFGTSLVAQWLKICLPMEGTWVQALVQEDPTCHRATKPVRHSY